MGGMARRTSATPPPEDFEEHIVDVDVSEEMQSSFLEYAYSVIYSRALPDARDGLKPVHRRILYQMSEMGLRPDRAHVKCARVVGDVMGKLHPHGDGAIYDTLVRMAQPFAMRVPLVDGHGNFGSLDSGPAAYRYTECRMSPAALLMTDAGETCRVRRTRDHRTSTICSPHRPYLLGNGAAGIASDATTCRRTPWDVFAAARHLVHILRYVATLCLVRSRPTDLRQDQRLDCLREAIDGRSSPHPATALWKTSTRGARRSLCPTALLVGPRGDSRIKELGREELVGIADLKDLPSGLGAAARLGSRRFRSRAVLERLPPTPMEDSFGINSGRS